MPGDQPVTPRPAAAVVLLREGDDGRVAVFLVQRHSGSAFMPDVFVFPGGAVASSDAAVERRPELCAPAGTGATELGRGFRAAAVRECFEEAGVLLARRGGAPLVIASDDAPRFAAYRDALNARLLTLAEIVTREGLTLSTDELLHWAHWITPEESAIRFDTHFFLAAMPPGQEAAHDQLETTAGLWATPEEALERHDRGELPLSGPTLHQLRDLTGLAGTADAWARFRGRTPRTIVPRLDRRSGRTVIVMPDEP